ncbi:MAG: hypothetical protein LBM73_01130 [Candidatus Nomurabacteria bacterium]|jgi:23S rRNA (cytidine1920-2'-O)/16S rRNA (cytidine1409-2'-O)-methyltransferase|nr:hypothetical protein [Candidatus Nomurabacteria bacterium]
MKTRLDKLLAARGLTSSRSQAESYIHIGKVRILAGGTWRTITRPGYVVDDAVKLKLEQAEQFVSRAALKLQSAAGKLGIDFGGKLVLDVGSSTGGFTQFALSRGARKVIAVDVGTDQMERNLRRDPLIELYEKTDIRVVVAASLNKKCIQPKNSRQNKAAQNDKIVVIPQPDLILIDVSFVSLREILPHIARRIAGAETLIAAMVKPQFETGARLKNAGVIKNDRERRKILADFEGWAKKMFTIQAKADSAVAGSRGNLERFYLLKLIKKSGLSIQNPTTS